MAIRSRVLAFLVLPVLLGSSVFANEPAPIPVPHLRYRDPLIAAAIARGAASATFQALLDRIAQSNVVVYLERGPCRRRGTGQTQFLSSAAGIRYAQVTVNLEGIGDAQTALLGHELRHVAELADAPWVHDAAGYAALYREIGEASCGAPTWCFDTRAARDAGAQVFRELRGLRTE